MSSTALPEDWWKNKAIEIVTWGASDSYIKDRGTIQPALDITATKTPDPIWVGMHKDGTTGCGIITWPSVKYHRDFQATPEFGVLAEKWAPILADLANPGIKETHAHFATNPAVAFNAPVTEIATVEPEQGLDKDEVRSLVNELVDIVKAMPGNVGGVAQAEIEEAPGNILLAIGWESVEAQSQVHDAIKDFVAKIGGKLTATVSLMVMERRQ